ncbi:hypothetical protein V7152_17275 [Neobacillus drentensis]|uniref:hypothetical protein n=1 Tax=Neobacillus drentensis TaxID=220684 RepID=UPI002FFF0149
MEGKDQNQKSKSTREMDPFSRFLFGNLKRGERHKESKNNSQEIPEQNKQLSLNTRSNHHDDWLFGRRKKEPVSGNKNSQNQTQSTQDKIENFMNNVDIGLLMETYDTIVTTTKQYKPLIKGIVPFFSKISDKFKK